MAITGKLDFPHNLTLLFMKCESFLKSRFTPVTFFFNKGAMSTAYCFLYSPFKLLVSVSAFSVKLVGDAALLVIEMNDLVCDQGLLVIYMET